MNSVQPDVTQNRVQSVFDGGVRIYENLTTLLWMSVLSCVLSVFVVPIGGVSMALCETTAAVFRDNLPRRERERLRYFIRAVRRHFREGLLYSALLSATYLSLVLYFVLALSQRDLLFVIAVGSMYVASAVTVWVFRTCHLAVSSRSRNLRAPTALRESGLTLLRSPEYSFVQVCVVTGVTVVSVAFVAIFPLVWPGLVASIEVITFDRIGNPRKLAQLEGEK